MKQIRIIILVSLALIVCNTSAYAIKVHSKLYINIGTSTGGFRAENNLSSIYSKPTTGVCSPSFLLGIDFGKNKKEIWGIEFGLYLNQIEIDIESERIPCDLSYRYLDDKKKSNYSMNVNLTNLILEFTGKVIPFRFEKFLVFMKLGAEAHFTLMKRLHENPELLGQTLVKLTNIGFFNVAGKAAIGIEVLDGLISLGLFVRRFLLEQYDNNADNLEGGNKFSISMVKGQVNMGVVFGLDLGMIGQKIRDRRSNKI